MDNLNKKSLESNRQIKINFDSGDLFSDAGLLLMKEFTCKLGFIKILQCTFKTNDTATAPFHKDDKNLWQMSYQILGTYFEDDCADKLTTDSVLTVILGNKILASQPTLSFFSIVWKKTTLEQFYNLIRKFRKIVYAIKKPKILLLDLDSTILDTYENQKEEGFNFHYQSHGYYPLVCYDGITGDLLKIQLRDETDYSSSKVEEFLQSLLDEFQNDYLDILLFLRGDSGFTKPELYGQCKTNGVSYVIHLKESNPLGRIAAEIEEFLTETTRNSLTWYAVEYGEFMYQAGS